MDTNNEIEKILKYFKPEGAQYRYRFCVFCDKPDNEGSMIMTEFGICRKCCKELLSKYPHTLYRYAARVFLYASTKQIIM